MLLWEIWVQVHDPGACKQMVVPQELLTMGEDGSTTPQVKQVIELQVQVFYPVITAIETILEQ